MRFAASITEDELKTKIMDALRIHEPDIDNYSTPFEHNDIVSLTKKIEKDLSKVEFDSENILSKELSWTNPAVNLHGICTYGGLTFLGLSAGGDWEYPVFFIIYWAGKELRAYIPTKGNPWNRKNKKAYGNYDGDDDEEIEFDNPENYEANNEEMLKDILARIKVK